ncbi:MAG: hypothetical protein CMJ19_02325 [Phycisphaeraceae bacterium]|nr:hypothetical protein [Phycisphaeraceae bacterium]
MTHFDLDKEHLMSAQATAATLSRPSFTPINPTPEQLEGVAFSRPRPRELQHALTHEQLDFFWANGYVSLPGLFTHDEAMAWQEASDRIYRDKLVDPMNVRYDFAEIKDADGNATDENILWKIDPFHDLDPSFRRAVFDRRILDALASIYDGREPRLFKDKLIYKPPHTHGNGLHQDYNWWQGYCTSLISVAVSIDPATEENGCTVVYPRDPREGYIGELGTFEHKIADSVDPDAAVKNIAKPGDVLLFHCFTPHEAGPNTTDHVRRQMFLTYNDSADGEHYFSHREHYFEYYKQGHYKEEDRDRVFFE